MKVFWLLLFGICTLTFYTFATECRVGTGYNNEHEYCTIKIYENGTNCAVEYGSSSVVSDDVKDFYSEYADYHTYCDIEDGRTANCYCRFDYCNGDITRFEGVLRAAAYKKMEGTNLKKVSICIRHASKRECAVGMPENMVLQKISEHSYCTITILYDWGSVVSVGHSRREDLRMRKHEHCIIEGNNMICRCNGHRCNILGNTFNEKIEILKYGKKYEIYLIIQKVLGIISSFTSKIFICGGSVAVYDQEGRLSCAKVFKKKENGACTMELSSDSRERKGECVASDPNFDDDSVTCVCEDDKCNVEGPLARSNMMLDGDGCVQAIPSTTTSTSTTSPSTTAMTTTTPPEQLTCWASDISTVTKDKTNSVCFIDYAMINSRCELRGKGIDEEVNGTPGCRIAQSIDKGTRDILRCTCVENRCNGQLDADLWEHVASENAEHMELIECVNRMVHGVTPSPTTSTSTTPTSTTAMTTTTPPEQLTCWTSDISTVTKDKTNSVCFIDYAMINSRCELRGRGIDEDENGTPGCRIVENQNKGSILRCTCAENRCNAQVDDMWEKVESNNTKHVELIECVDRLVLGEPLPTSGTSVVTPSPTSRSESEDAKSSNFFGLFIGSAAFNGLQMVTIVALIVALVKMKKKGGEAKQGTAKIEQKEQQKATAIQIEKPIVKQESSTKPTRTSTAKVSDKNAAAAADTTGNEDLDTTGGTTGSDSTGPEEGFNEVRVSVRALKKK